MDALPDGVPGRVSGWGSDHASRVGFRAPHRWGIRSASLDGSRDRPPWRRSGGDPDGVRAVTPAGPGPSVPGRLPGAAPWGDPQCPLRRVLGPCTPAASGWPSPAGSGRPSGPAPEGTDLTGIRAPARTGSRASGHPGGTRSVRLDGPVDRALDPDRPAGARPAPRHCSGCLSPRPSSFPGGPSRKGTGQTQPLPAPALAVPTLKVPARCCRKRRSRCGGVRGRLSVR